MTSKRELERRLASVADFTAPIPELEQYRTPADIAAHVIHRAALEGDIEGRTVVDLGTGTGMFAIGAAIAGAGHIVGMEADAAALEQARRNAAGQGVTRDIDWVIADATRSPLCVEGATVLMNPPFGAHRSNRHADRAFLETASRIASVSHSFHNEGSRDFVESFVADRGGTITHAFQATISLPRQFTHHDREAEPIDAEVYRIEW
ncbi:MAG: METTL5 family protein [Halodesulfurarchaeum sp.]